MITAEAAVLPGTEESNRGTKSAEEKSGNLCDLRVLVRDIFLDRTPVILRTENEPGRHNFGRLGRLASDL